MNKVAEMVEFSKPDGTELTTVTMTVTPQQAQDWLDAMPTQRRVRQPKVDQLERQIKTGRWKTLPHGIVFDTDGHLIDGQHRLTAIVRAGKPVQMRATFNAARSMKRLIDGSATPKGIEDVLRQEGLQPQLTQILSLPIRMLFRMDNGASVFSGPLLPSNEEAIETYHRHPRLVDAGQMVAKVRLAPSRGLLAFYVYQGLLFDQTITALFCEQLAVGESMFAGDPALLLRNTWIKDRVGKVRRDPSDQARMIVATLNAALAGKKLSTWRGIEFGKSKIPPIGSR